MPAKTFKSKLDRWLLTVFAAGVAAELGVLVALATQVADPVLVTVLILASLLLAALVAWIILGIRYVVDREWLRVVAGPFRWRIRLADIVAVEPSRSPLSSPAASLGRLRIRYGKGRRILVSPADRDGFLRAIGRPLQAPRR